MTTLWAGKKLADQAVLELRRLIDLERRLGDEETAANLERFLPENKEKWTPDELETGAHVGPWLTVDAEISMDEKGLR